jgi:hypothetical protein
LLLLSVIAIIEPIQVAFLINSSADYNPGQTTQSVPLIQAVAKRDRALPHA